MAEFALGLTKTAVEGAVSRVKSAFEEEAELKVRVQNDLVFITGEFQMMQSFLNAANSERTKNEVVRTWVRQVRDLAFDVEDCIELVINLDDKPTWFWRLVPSCISMAPPPPLDMAVMEIQQLKKRVEDVSQRNTRYNLLSDSGSKSAVTTVSSLAVELKQATTYGSAASAFCILKEVWEASSKHRGMGSLNKLILSEGTALQVISLWGSPGAADLGASHVIREASNVPQIYQDFTIRAWIKLIHPFNPDKFLKSLLAQFYTTSSHQPINFRTTVGPCQTKTEELMLQVREHRYLVILEDVFTVAEWEVIRMYLPDTKKGSRIVVSTQHLGLALSFTGKPYQVSELIKFSHDQSLCSFFSQNCGHYGNEHGDASRYFSNRRQEARDWANKFQLVGRQIEAAVELSKYLQGGGGVLSVWGIAGVGKTTIARTVYYNKILGGQHSYTVGKTVYGFGFADIFSNFSWVNVPHPFNLMEFCWRLLVDFHSDDLEAKEAALVCIIDGTQGPIQGCRNFLQKECLLVIDGLSSTDDWDLIRDALLPDTAKGSIIVITNETNVANHCVAEENRVINVKGLKPDATFRLFKKVAFGGKELNRQETEVSKITLAKCGRLARVIAVIGEQYSLSGRNIHWLEALNRNFMGKLETDSKFQSLSGLFSWMKTYFDACSDALKPCIFYLSVFPADYNIRRRRLLMRWIAEGYSRAKFGIGALEDGEILFSELVKLSIIQEEQSQEKLQKSIKVDVFQVNGFFHEYIMSRPMEDNLVFELEGHCNRNLKHAGQHLTIRSSWDRDEIVFKSMDLSRLRSLTVFGEWRSFLISNNINMGLLRVLDLEDTSGVTDGDLDHIGKLLPRLKFLSLRGCKDITHLSGSLCGLRQLQTLDVRNTSIIKLPPAIVKLHKLQYIRAGKAVIDHQPLATEGDDPGQPSSDEDNNGTAADIQAVTVAIDGTRTCRSATNEDPTSTTIAQWRRRAHDLVESNSCNWLSKKKKDNGVEVPVVGIGNLTALHTLGVVKVNGADGKALLKEVKRLTQLRKLGVSGINKKNWQDLLSAISGHIHLQSLSVCLDKGGSDAANFLCDMLSGLPKTLDSLKLYTVYGRAQVSPALFLQFYYLRKVDVKLIISTQEDIDSLMKLPCQDIFYHLCVKSIQDGELRYGRWENSWIGTGFKSARVLEIDCASYKSKIVFGNWIPQYVEVLRVNCSTTEASLELSGLDELCRLKEVWLKGSCSDTVKQHLQQKLDELHSLRVEKAAEGWQYPCLRVPLKLEDQTRPS